MLEVQLIRGVGVLCVWGLLSCSEGVLELWALEACLQMFMLGFKGRNYDHPKLIKWLQQHEIDL